MEKVKRDFEEVLKTFNKSNGWTVTGDTWATALQALWQAIENRDKLDEIVKWINDREEWKRITGK